ncbi:MAG: haloalkane dehalogenase [Actinomycetota bacterium]
MEALRTPDDRFRGLPDFPFEPNYLEVDGLRIHYLDEGPGTAAPIFLLHGEPSWSFLYRKMIPILADAGHRAVAADLVGFGRSDKPVAREDYTYQRHVDWMRGFVESADLRDVVLFGQDWGGLIGLRLAAEDPDRFSRLVAANTFLPTGDMPATEAFMRWREYSQTHPTFDVGWLVDRACVKDLPAEVKAAYDAPFPDDTYKAGARQFPLLVPITPDDPASEPNRRAWDALARWEKPFLTVFSDSDPVTRGGDRFFQQAVPGASGQPHHTVEDAGHYLQEDKGEEIARLLVEWLQD